MNEIRIFPARRVITMNPGFPFGDAVAVRGDRILGVGSIDELRSWDDDAIIDDRFSDKVLTPGFVEAHAHVMTGGVWKYPYVGFFDRRDPNGVVHAGCKNIDAVVARLAQAEAALDGSDGQLIAWGLDPIYFDGERMVASHLDRVSKQRPIFVFHASGHLATANTAMLRSSGVDEHTKTPGVARAADGKPNGELQEPPAMLLAGTALIEIGRAMQTDDALWNLGFEARNAGHTLVTDLGTTQVERADQLERWRRIVDDPAYPARVMLAVRNAGPAQAEELGALGATLARAGGNKLRFGIVKLVLDGSIQGFTARVGWPYYYRPPAGQPENGLWLIPPDQMADLVTTYHEAGLTVHCHCNGDQSAQVFIDAVEAALERHPRWDHRHTVQHCQLTTQTQYRRMAALGMCANIFSNHIFYWGDQHRDVTVGPERAARMDACATAKREGVSFSIHSDAPITPLGHLHTMWCAVNRQTASGRVLGPDEQISVMDALAAATLGGAHQLKLDHELGSIEAGKLADFAVLDDDPLEVDALKLKDIGVWGTVLGGEPQPASHG